MLAVNVLLRCGIRRPLLQQTRYKIYIIWIHSGLSDGEIQEPRNIKAHSTHLHYIDASTTGWFN